MFYTHKKSIAHHFTNKDAKDSLTTKIDEKIWPAVTEKRNFTYELNSPCIDAGNPSQNDPDGSIRDIGANIYYSYLLGDCNQDNSLDVIDIVYNMNNCILNYLLDNCNCSDVNEDQDYNVLDIVLIVDHILEEILLDGCPLESLQMQTVILVWMF